MLSLLAGSVPDKPALVCGQEVLTYASYDERSNRAAGALEAVGVQPDDRVAIVAFNSIAAFEAAAGVRKCRAVWVPVNFRLRGRELAHVISDSGARAVCVGPGLVEHVEAARRFLTQHPALLALGGAPAPAGWVSFEELVAEASSEERVNVQLGSGGFMIYTSGTTGQPKGARRGKGAVADALAIIGMFGLSGDDVHLMAGPGYHSAVAVFTMLTAACAATTVIMPAFDPEEALALIERHEVTTTFMAPTLLRRIMDLPEEVRARYDVSSMRALILGAAPCPFSLKQEAVAYFGEVLWEFYGATETGVNLVLRPEDQLRKPGSAGQAGAGQEVRVLDDDGNPVPDYEPGELWIRNGVLAEYHNQPAATASSMREGFFSVGDIAYRDSEGYYYICDRKTDLIVSGGVNIYPAEIEACLADHSAVHDAAVIGVPDEHWGEAVKALVVLRPGTGATERELLDWCKERVADYKRPRSVDFVEELPRDQTGKLFKRQIREPYWASSGRLV
jgi:fatty-acyl-CoA synthase/long-chain acyl-CoA synthetase